MVTNKILNTTFLLFAIASLPACSVGDPTRTLRASMYEPTTMTQRDMIVEKEYTVIKKKANEVDYPYLTNFVEEYKRDGASPIYAVFAYDPDNDNGKLEAFNKSNILKGQLAKLGAKNNVIKTLPVLETEGTILTIGYDKLSARGPRACDGHALGKDDSFFQPTNYVGGCTIKDLRARQTAYPGDLLGQDTMSDYNAKRAGVVVARDAYSGEISDFVPSYILSEVGN